MAAKVRQLQRRCLGVRGAVQTRDRGAIIRLDQLVSSPEQGLRGADPEQLSHDPRVHVPPQAPPSEVQRAGGRLGKVAFKHALSDSIDELNAVAEEYQTLAAD